MIKPLLAFAGKFVPGVNVLAYGYGAYQMAEAGVKLIRTIRGDAPNDPIPVVSGKGLVSLTDAASSLATGLSVGTTAYQWYKGGQGDRLDSYKKEMGKTINEVRKELDEIKKNGEGTRID